VPITRNVNVRIAALAGRTGRHIAMPVEAYLRLVAVAEVSSKSQNRLARDRSALQHRADGSALTVTFEISAAARYWCAVGLVNSRHEGQLGRLSVPLIAASCTVPIVGAAL